MRDADDNARQSYDVAISSLRERLEKSKVVIGDCVGVPVRFIDNHNRVIVYGIAPSGTAEPVYVGSTTQTLRNRIRAHIHDANNGGSRPFHQWILANKDGFDVIVLERTHDANRVSCEKYWIEKYKATILNVTDGGLGQSGNNFSGTLHAKRISAARKRGSYFNCQCCDKRFWRKPSEIALGYNKYCSHACSNARHKHGVTADV